METLARDLKMEVIRKNNGVQVYLCGEYHYFSEKAAIELRDKLTKILEYSYSSERGEETKK